MGFNSADKNTFIAYIEGTHLDTDQSPWLLFLYLIFHILSQPGHRARWHFSGQREVRLFSGHGQNPETACGLGRHHRETEKTTGALVLHKGQLQPDFSRAQLEFHRAMLGSTVRNLFWCCLWRTLKRESNMLVILY